MFAVFSCFENCSRLLCYIRQLILWNLRFNIKKRLFGGREKCLKLFDIKTNRKNYLGWHLMIIRCILPTKGSKNTRSKVIHNGRHRVAAQKPNKKPRRMHKHIAYVYAVSSMYTMSNATYYKNLALSRCLSVGHVNVVCSLFTQKMIIYIQYL